MPNPSPSIPRGESERVGPALKPSAAWVRALHPFVRRFAGQERFYRWCEWRFKHESRRGEPAARSLRPAVTIRSQAAPPMTYRTAERTVGQLEADLFHQFAAASDTRPDGWTARDVRQYQKMNGLPADGIWGPRTAAVYKVETGRGEVIGRKCKVCGTTMGHNEDKEREECPFRGADGKKHIPMLVKRPLPRPVAPVRPNPSRSTWYCIPFVIGLAGLGQQVFFVQQQNPTLVMFSATLVGMPAMLSGGVGSSGGDDTGPR